MKNSKCKKLAMILIICAAVFIAIILIANAVVVFSTCKKIYSYDSDVDKKCDAILVLGAGITDDGKPKGMLEDRLKTAIASYNSGISDKIIVSGDHISDDYDEVSVMKKYLVDSGIPSENIYKDHSGISTFASVTRAKELFGVKSVAIVTQRYHLYRALYIANALDIDCIGIDAALRNYVKQPIFTAREMIARIKDIYYSAVKTEVQYKDAFIGLDVSGDTTNEKM